MVRRGRSSRAGSLVTIALGVVMPLMLIACSGPGFGQTGGPATGSTGPASPTTTPAPISPLQAWGNYPATHITLPLASVKFFTPLDIFPDGSTIAGVGGNGTQMQVMLVQVASGATRVLYTAPSDFGSTFQVRTDGRFVAWAGGNQGEGVQSNRNIVGYSDVQSGNVTILADANQSAGIVQLIHGTMVWSTTPTNATTPSGPIFATDLATNTTTNLPITQDWSCGSASWPYLLCFSNGMTSWKLYNFTTHQFTTATSLGSLTPAATGQAVALEGTTVFWLHGQSGTSDYPTQLTQIDQIDQAGATPRALGPTFKASALIPPMANARLVVWTCDGCGNMSHELYAWDRAQNRLIAFDHQQYLNTPQFVVSDHALMITRVFGGGQGDIIVINTDTLPKAAKA